MILENLNFIDNEEEWLNVLPAYQKNTILELLKENTPEKVATIWLETSTGNNSPFSADKGQNNKHYFTYLKKEVHKFLCGNPDYDTQRDSFQQLIQSEGSKTAIISLLSSAIGAKIGLSATFIAPVLVLLVIVISKTSLNAWCSMQNEANPE